MVEEEGGGVPEEDVEEEGEDEEGAALGGPEGLSPGFEAGAEEVGVHVEEVDGEGTAGCGVDGSADGVGPVGGVGLCGHE